MTPLVAINTIVIADPSGLYDIRGYNDDGSPILLARQKNVLPGEPFEIEDETAGELIKMGVATDDLDYVDPRVTAVERVHG